MFSVINDLNLIISEDDYNLHKGTDWPLYNEFIKNNFSVDKNILVELNNFVDIMKQNYNNLRSPRTIELSIENQKRQQQVFFNKNVTVKHHCDIAWNTLGVNQNGNIFICESPSWIPVFVGNLLETENIYDILNSKAAQQIRQEILAGRYFYCNNKLCVFFDYLDKSAYTLKSDDIAPLEYKSNIKTTVDKIPTKIIFDFDYTCNFKCPSCRTEVINWNDHHIIKPTNDKLVDRIKKEIIDKISDQPITIRWAGGEPFMSESYIDLLDYIIASGKQNIQNIIQTNGSLLQQKQILVKRLLPYIKELRISFDAGTEETYKKIRVNGNWSRLIDNARWVKEVISISKYNTKLTADFVVQKDNYKEIPLFVDLCKNIGIDNINLQKMWNWGTWDQQEFDEKNIYTPTHPDYEDLKKYFKLAGQSIAKI